MPICQAVYDRQETNSTLFLRLSNLFQSFLPARMNNPMFAATSEHETNEFMPPMAYKRARTYEPESRGLYLNHPTVREFLGDQNYVKTPFEVC